jgi:steroid delta-isomerase-like uncharacterized protein
MHTTAVPTDVSNAEIVRWAFDRLNQRDLSALTQFWTDDTVERFPDATCRGTDEIVSYFEDTFEAVPDAHIEIVGIAGEGNDVFVQWHMTGTHSGTLLGIAPTGKELAIDGMDHFVIRDGKVVSNFVIIDQLQYARQIGMMPPDGSAADRAMKAAFNVRTKVAERFKQ